MSFLLASAHAQIRSPSASEAAHVTPIPNLRVVVHRVPIDISPSEGHPLKTVILSLRSWGQACDHAGAGWTPPLLGRMAMGARADICPVIWKAVLHHEFLHAC